MLRKFSKLDLDQVIAIENSVQIDPWSREIFQTCLKSGCLAWVIEDHVKIIGFIFISIYQGECHIYNLAVKRNHQGRGWGRQLMNCVLNYAKQHSVIIAYLEVRESNLPAITLYKSLEFEVIGTRKNYYENPSGYEDALVLVKKV